jgi:phytoene dehydrogenase-like protein
MKYDCIIIGGGLSGLAAGIRLAHFGKKVCICEQHSKTGGLNSWYTKRGIEVDSGLHAMTNFASPDDPKSLPLRKLLRQLRIPYEALDLREQNGSEIAFPGKRLRFSNDFELLQSEIAMNFPEEIDRFNNLDRYIQNYDGLDVNASYVSARSILQEKINNSMLIEMLLCPLMYYGSAVENDMDFAQFTIMYKSIFHEGFCRPATGIKVLLHLLEKRFKECGGEIANANKTKLFSEKALALNCEIRKINIAKEKVESVELKSGEILETENILSSAGYAETLYMVNQKMEKSIPHGNLAFVETVALLNKRLSSQGHNSTIVFFNDSAEFAYEKPDTYVDLRSGVLCCPDNFQFHDGDALPYPQIRVTMLADHQQWFAANRELYAEKKTEATKSALAIAKKYTIGSELQDMIKLTDSFTPTTIRRFTGHFNGAVYGCPEKQKTGITEVQNLFICGTDQGFLGITGSMLSGISMANMHILKG